MLKHNHQPLIMEITILSAQGLKPTSSTPFSHRLRPFITLTTVPPTACKPTNVDKQCQVYKTRVDDQGGVNPTWGDKFHVPLDTTFFSHRYSSIYLQLHTKRLIAGQAQLGWCQIPAHDIGLPPAGSVRYLSYRLRARDGTRSPGIVNLAVKLEPSVPVSSQNMDMCHTVIGVPVTVFPLVGGGCPVRCQGQVEERGVAMNGRIQWFGSG